MQPGESERTRATNRSPSPPAPVDDPRVYLAAERTFLAWIRTSVSLMGFGFLIARFALWLREYGVAGSSRPQAPPQMSTWLGLLMVCVGVAVCVMAAVRYRGYVKALQRGETNPSIRSGTSLLVAAALALVGLAITVHIIML
jgi:putative membrane protein